MRTKNANNIELKYKLYIFDFRIKEYVFFDNFAREIVRFFLKRKKCVLQFQYYDPFLII